MKKDTKEKDPVLIENTIFSKEQIINSNKFKLSKDALNVLLEENKTYTIKEVSIILNDFMKGKVK